MAHLGLGPGRYTDRSVSLLVVRPLAMDEVLIGGIEKRQIVIVDYDPRWPAQFQKHAGILSGALGSHAPVIEHVGSTSVPQLAAKPIIDIDVLVEDSSDEASYLPACV